MTNQIKGGEGVGDGGDREVERENAPGCLQFFLIIALIVAMWKESLVVTVGLGFILLAFYL